MTRSTIPAKKVESIGETPAAGSEKSDPAPTELRRDQANYLVMILSQIEAVAKALLDEIGDDAVHEQKQLLALTIETLCHGALIEVEAR